MFGTTFRDSDLFVFSMINPSRYDLYAEGVCTGNHFDFAYGIASQWAEYSSVIKGLYW